MHEGDQLGHLGHLDALRHDGAGGATDGGDWRGAAFANTVSIYSMEWAPFGSEEWGWEAYLPLIQEELGTRCAPGTERFAQALAG